MENKNDVLMTEEEFDKETKNNENDLFKKAAIGLGVTLAVGYVYKKAIKPRIERAFDRMVLASVARMTSANESEAKSNESKETNK